MKTIAVCICTYKRPELLRRLLRELAAQETQEQFIYSIVVVDNDRLQSAERVALDSAAGSSVRISYLVEPRQNIALARNKAIENAKADFIAFIDDDEFPVKSWLLTLFKAVTEYKVDGVLGPVHPHFDVEPPRWVVEGKFYDRASYPTGLVIDWKKGRTGNVLLKTEIFREEEKPFRPEFRTGEDQDFFRRMIDKGHVFIWCHEAVAYEVVPAIRWQPRFMLKRALLQGASSFLHPASRLTQIAKSAIAVPGYTALLPITVVLGRRRFMLCLLKLCDHLGRLLALAGINAVTEQYITE